MWRLALALMPWPALADSLVATRVIPAHAVVAAEDVALVAADLPGAARDPAQAVGQETRVAIYPGRAVRLADLGAAALVERNQIVALSYRRGGLAILTEGRALGRAAPGELVEVLNLASRQKVTGRVGPDGSVFVGETP